MVKWFGYKLHLLVDSVHELPLAFIVTKASEDDTTNLAPLVKDLETHVKIQSWVGITMSVAHRHPREGGGPVGRPSENGNPVHQLSGFPPPRE